MEMIYPEAFSAVLGNMFNKLDWNNKGLSMDGEHLNHIRFDNHILLIANNPEKLQQLVNILTAISNWYQNE